ncbi:hypothetical protein LINPERHAP2_LOCUS37878 [Linum perenne]
MASKANSALALFLALSLVFFSMVSARPTLDQFTIPSFTPFGEGPAPSPTSSTGKCPTKDLGICGMFPLTGACCSVISKVTDAADAADCLCSALKDYPAQFGRDQLIGYMFMQCGKKAPSKLSCTKKSTDAIHA